VTWPCLLWPLLHPLSLTPHQFPPLLCCGLSSIPSLSHHISSHLSSAVASSLSQGQFPPVLTSSPRS
jgi:hypothetical protein